MEAKDFMLNDFVHSKLHNVDTQILDIEGGSYNSVWLTNKECWERHYMNEIEPISLTKDILYKNFPDTLGNVYWEWDDEKSNEEENWYEFSISSKNVKVNMTIRYVHELQHALRLCGIEKEIEL